MRTETTGPGGYIPVSRPGSAAYATPGRGGGIPIVRKDDIESLIAQLDAQYTGSVGFNQNPQALALRDNLRFIRDYKPLTLEEKKSKDVTIDDIKDLLLDLTGYGSAIASLIPIPEVRLGGVFAQTATMYARNPSGGSAQRGARLLNRAIGEYNQPYVYNQRGMYNGRKKSRR